MITVKNLEAFNRFIHQPDQFEIERIISREESLDDSQKLNQQNIESQIKNRKQQKNDLQQMMKSCSRKVRAICRLLYIESRIDFTTMKSLLDSC